MNADPSSPRHAPREGFASVNNARLYYRDVGQGRPILVLHGGPDFDHHYFLPELDSLSDTFRLIYYDQRGRGQSNRNVKADDVTLDSEMADLDGLRAFFHLGRIAVLGHSWGGVLAMEYAIRHPERVSHLILMNTAPASRDDYLLLRRELPRMRAAGEDDEMKALASTVRFAQGDLETDAAYYRIHFRPTVRRAEQLERVIRSLRMGLTPDDVVRARAIEARLYAETWNLSDYNLLPQLARLRIPTLVLHGDQDLIPLACASNIARVMPEARLVVIPDCGHFSFIECPGEVRQAMTELLDRA